MTGNSDGLSPSLKPFLGVGHNRALPAAFGFDNGLKGDGTNDYLRVPNLTGSYLFDGPLSIECWGNEQIGDFDGLGLLVTGLVNKVLLGGFTSMASTFTVDGRSRNLIFADMPYTDGRYHVVLTYDGYSRWELLFNGGYYNSFNINTVALGQAIVDFKLFTGEFYGQKYSNAFISEFRIYNKKLTLSEIVLNFNNGVGNNPCNTENLLTWYKFQEFETLDFSPLQDNSDLRLGLRDHSGQNNHAQPVNMITDPANPGYVLKPF